MLFNQEIKDKIEDALIYFEDAGYSFNINHGFYCDNRFDDKVYDLLKKVNTNEDVDFGDRIYISLNGRKSVMSWKEYQWYHSELKTAITRMTDNLDNINIINTTDSQTGIEINQKNWQFKNLKDLSDKCKYFNANNKFGKSNNIVVYPEYHPEEGVVLYVREIIPNTLPFRSLHGDLRRFGILDLVTKPEFITSYEKKKIGSRVLGDETEILISTKKESGYVSLERAFGEDCIEKRYEEGEAEKENPYLSSSTLSRFIVAKIKCDFIRA